MKILVAIDGSNDALEAVEWLADFPLPADAAVDVVNAARLPFPVESIVAMGWREFLAENQRAVDEVVGRLAKRWTRVTGRLLDGDAREAIVEASARERTDLIVLGARGHNAVTSFLLGSVSLGVTRHAPCAVLVCRGPARPIRSITLALDGSPDGRAALEYLAALPLAPDVAVQIVGVVEPMPYPGSAPEVIAPQLWGLIEEVENERRNTLVPVLTEAAAMLRPRVGKVTTVTPRGPVAATIVKEAESHGSDLVVVGARGLGALKRLALGSVSEGVLRHAPCPVLVVRPTPERD
jgi:nucleotide-binding universal stress UspA family protein